jgi:hypothetical protein
VKLASPCPVDNTAKDGQVYAQPLIVANATIHGCPGTLAYVVTENDMVYYMRIFSSSKINSRKTYAATTYAFVARCRAANCHCTRSGRAEHFGRKRANREREGCSRIFPEVYYPLKYFCE